MSSVDNNPPIIKASSASEPSYVKRSWTPDEDDAILKLVAIHGATNWTLIAQGIEGRAGKQCRERYHNHLQPNIKKGDWTEEENAKILMLQEKYGNQWAKITKELPGRTDNAVKNRWHAAIRSLQKGKNINKKSNPSKSSATPAAIGTTTSSSSSLQQPDHNQTKAIAKDYTKENIPVSQIQKEVPPTVDVIVKKHSPKVDKETSQPDNSYLNALYQHHGHSPGDDIFKDLDSPDNSFFIGRYSNSNQLQKLSSANVSPSAASVVGGLNKRRSIDGNYVRKNCKRGDNTYETSCKYEEDDIEDLVYLTEHDGNNDYASLYSRNKNKMSPSDLPTLSQIPSSIALADVPSTITDDYLNTWSQIDNRRSSPRSDTDLLAAPVVTDPVDSLNLEVDEPSFDLFEEMQISPRTSSMFLNIMSQPTPNGSPAAVPLSPKLMTVNR